MQSNYNKSCPIKVLTTDQQRDLGIVINKDVKWQKQTVKSCKTAIRAHVFIAHNSGTETKN